MQFRFQRHLVVLSLCSTIMEMGMAVQDDVCATALPSIMMPVRLSLMASVAPVSFSWYVFEMPQ